MYSTGLFTNSRTGEVVGETDIRNPEHEFTTDETATSYFITLRAENRCDVDEYTDTLLVETPADQCSFYAFGQSLRLCKSGNLIPE